MQLKTKKSSIFLPGVILVGDRSDAIEADNSKIFGQSHLPCVEGAFKAVMTALARLARPGGLVWFIS